MAEVAITLSGELFHSDSAELREVLQAAFDEGGCVVEVAEDFEKIEFGPLQVLIAAASEAKERGIEFAVKAMNETNAVSAALASHALQGAVPVVVGELTKEAQEQ